MENKTASQITDLQTSNKKLVVTYYASWCNVCSNLIPILDNLSNDYPNVTFVKVNVDENRENANSLNIQTVPTIMVYDGFTLINRSVGANKISVYTKILDKL